MRGLFGLLLVALASSGCAGATVTTPAVSSPVPAAPTPIIIYVPATPIIIYVAPSPSPTAAHTIAPTPKPTPISYASFSAGSWALFLKSPEDYIDKGFKVWGCISYFKTADRPDAFLAQVYYERTDDWYILASGAAFYGNASALKSFVKGDAFTADAIVLPVESNGTLQLQIDSIAVYNDNGRCGMYL